jgi:trehalose 6-phosphate phosphatase
MTGEAPPLDCAHSALFLDFDGTFVDFAPTPDAVRLRVGSGELLERLRQRLGGALAIVSGRRIADIDHYLKPLKLPASGVHGQEVRLPYGDLVIRSASPELEEARRRLSAAIRSDDPLMVEDKGWALVLHFRQHPAERGRALQLGAEAVAGLSDLYALEGHAIVEIRQRGVSKASAIEMFGDVGPFKARTPVFVGDDSTDEDGFAAASAAGGYGVKVGPGATRAPYRLSDVGAVHRWLADCL